MRDIAEEVHTMCIQRGIHVPCESFDGQWHTLVVRDVENQPLTLFQLQRDVWKHVERRTKKEIVDELKYLNKTVTWTISEDVHITDKSQKCIIATNGGLKLPQYRYWQISKTKETNDKADSNVYSVTLLDSVPDAVRETADIGLDVMAMTAITDDLEMEAFSSNTNDDEWSRELQYNDEDLNSEEGETLPTADGSNKATGNDRCSINNKNLDLNDMECLLSMFKTTKDCNKKMQWNSVSPGDLLEYFTTYDMLGKLLDVQVRVLVRYLKKTKGMTGVKESSTKKVKLDGIAKFIGIEVSDISDKTNAKKKTRVRNISTLHALAAKALSKYSKQALNIILAEYIFEDEYESWIKPIENITINGEKIDWFYKPEFSTRRKQLEVKCIDSTHLFTRARRKTCTGGIEGMTNEAWTKVAKQKSTLLTPIMVEEISDPMSVSMARTHFSAGVEAEMRRNGDTKAANLCSDIRNWWESEDAAGISAECRIERRKALRRRLLTNVKFNRFPPPTQYVHGWPVQLWEGLLASMDAKAYLYAMVHGGTYNVRAFSSLLGETFFSELTLNDKRGQGTVTALEFSQYIGHTTEQLQIRLDTDRKFSFCTSKAKVYDVVDESCESEFDHEHKLCRVCNGDDRILPHSISTKDHPFDKEERKRLEGRRNRGHVSTERNAVLKGSLGVRWEKGRCNMSKMMPTKRMGISCDE